MVVGLVSMLVVDLVGLVPLLVVGFVGGGRFGGGGGRSGGGVRVVVVVEGVKWEKINKDNK